MSSYHLGESVNAETPYSHGQYSDKGHYHPNSPYTIKQANFSVSHLLDLEELPRENCAMYANTTPGMNGGGSGASSPSACVHGDKNKDIGKLLTIPPTFRCPIQAYLRMPL